jgi:hypothetical protein
LKMSATTSVMEPDVGELAGRDRPSAVFGGDAAALIKDDNSTPCSFCRVCSL